MRVITRLDGNILISRYSAPRARLVRRTTLASMDLPVMPPVRPMLAKSVKGIPDPSKFEGGLSFEPKWDGFRAIVFRDGDEIEITSRNTKPLTRYFPEVVTALSEQLPERCVLDGELFVANETSGRPRLEFETLQERIHPAASRINLLAEQTPASFVAFDALALGDDDLTALPFAERRARLEAALTDLPPPGDLTGRIHLTRTTTDPTEAEGWFHQFEGAGLDGVVAKPMAAPYQQNARTMLKIKHARTADVVLAGYRLHKTSTEARPLLGSMLLGLYDDGKLQHVGVAASFTEARRAELIDELAAARVRHRRPSVGRVAGVGDRQPGPRAGHAEPVERRQGPVLHSPAPRAGARGRLRAHGGQTVPAHGAVQALATRPRPRVLRLRPARGAGELRPH